MEKNETLRKQEVTNKIGSINILVCSAGVPHIGTAESTTEEDFTRIFNINVKGVYNSLHEVIPVMKKQNKGVILNICSVAASVGIPDRFAYSMSKGAVLAMTLTTADTGGRSMGKIIPFLVFKRQMR